MKRRTLVSAGALLALVAGLLLWHQLPTSSRDVATQVTDPRDAAAAASSAPIPSLVTDPVLAAMNESTGNPQLPSAAVEPGSDQDRLRINRFFLERYYPDLQAETGFGPDDVEKLLRLKGSDEAELEKGLGGAKYRRWKEYEARVQAQDAVNKLGRELPGDDQLSEDQANMLRASIFDEKRRRDEELRIRMYAAPSPTDLRSRFDFEMGNLAIREESDRRLLTAVKFFLSERQHAALPAAVIDPNLAKARENMERFRARAEGRGAQ